MKSLMGKKVKYCRAKVDDKNESTLFRGEGVIVGVIVGATRRIQIMVKDESEAQDKAWTLDLICIDPTDEDAAHYFEHHKKVRGLVDEHNKAQRQREQDKIKEVDDINAEMFGQPLEI